MPYLQSCRRMAKIGSFGVRFSTHASNGCSDEAADQRSEFHERPQRADHATFL